MEIVAARKIDIFLDFIYFPGHPEARKLKVLSSNWEEPWLEARRFCDLCFSLYNDKEEEGSISTLEGQVWDSPSKKGWFGNDFGGGEWRQLEPSNSLQGNKMLVNSNVFLKALSSIGKSWLMKTRERLRMCKWGLSSSNAVDAWVQVILRCVLPSGKFRSSPAPCLLDARGTSFLDVTARNVSTYLCKTPVWAPSLGGETVVCMFSHRSRADPMHNCWLYEAEPGAPSETDVAKIND